MNTGKVPPKLGSVREGTDIVHFVLPL